MLGCVGGGGERTCTGGVKERKQLAVLARRLQAQGKAYEVKVSLARAAHILLLERLVRHKQVLWREEHASATIATVCHLSPHHLHTTHHCHHYAPAA